MNINKIIKLTKISILSSVILTPVVNAAVVFEDQFDQVDPVEFGLLDDGETTWLRSQVTSNSATTAGVADGRLHVFSRDNPYGGATTLPLPELNFFNRELTFTFQGVNLESLSEDGVYSAQGVKIGVGSYLAGESRSNRWHSYSNFGVSFLGSGYFALTGYNKLRNLSRVPTQEIPTPYLNYNLTTLSSVKLTLDDVNYRLLFEFGNPLNSLSLAGEHHLSEDLWHVSDQLRSLALQKKAAEERLELVDPNDVTALSSAETTLETIMVEYNAMYAEEEAVLGNTLVFFGGVSADREGATVSVDSITVEETSILQVLRP